MMVDGLIVYVADSSDSVLGIKKALMFTKPEFSFLEGEDGIEISVRWQWNWLLTRDQIEDIRRVLFSHHVESFNLTQTQQLEYFTEGL